jgi:zinc protease
MSLNRVTQPGIEKIQSLNFKYFEKTNLKSGVELYYLAGGTEPVIKLELVFNAGKINEPKCSVAAFTAAMMNEGTKHRSGKLLLDGLDYWGAHFQVKTFNDDAVATLYCLEKYLEGAIPLFIEAITESVFPEKELNVLKRNSSEKLKINNKKNEYISRISFNECLYGNEHPLGKRNSTENISNIERSELLDFYQRFYLSGLKYVILTGNFKQETIGLVEKAINNSALAQSALNTGNSIPTIQKFGKLQIEGPNKTQVSLKIGKIGPDRKDVLFTDFQIVNLVFGGFFGSRLMKKIREDLGLTYGIHSFYEPGKVLNIWSIETEVNNKNKALAVSEIYKEVNKLLIENISVKEIEVARNYLCGAILKSLDNPLSMSSRMKTHIDFNLNKNYMENYIKEIYAANPDSLLHAANKFLSNDQIIEIVVS